MKERLALRRKRPRRGASLVEMVIVMGVASVMLTVGVGTIHLLLDADRSSSAAVASQMALSRCSERLRSDVHAAIAASVTAAENDAPAALTLTLPDDRTVRYEIDGHALKRTVSVGEATRGRDTFRFPPGSTLEFVFEEEANIVRLAVRRPTPRDDRNRT
ncbi:MAG: pilus assembly FimT family protein, partial [Planctomycetaceae bacterium]